jgi:hypothetical protein
VRIRAPPPDGRGTAAPQAVVAPSRLPVIGRSLVQRVQMVMVWVNASRCLVEPVQMAWLIRPDGHGEPFYGCGRVASEAARILGREVSTV